jgi:hypothetical protein
LQGSLTAPAASTVATLSATLQATLPTVFPQVQSVRRLPATVGANAFQTIGFVTIAPSVTVTFPSRPSRCLRTPSPTSRSSIRRIPPPAGPRFSAPVTSLPVARSRSTLRRRR